MNRKVRLRDLVRAMQAVYESQRETGLKLEEIELLIMNPRESPEDEPCVDRIEPEPESPEGPEGPEGPAPEKREQRPAWIV